jgi:hypothetical protein
VTYADGSDAEALILPEECREALDDFAKLDALEKE